MTAQNFMNVVRFKLKSDCVIKYFEAIDETSFEGMTQRYIAKTGAYDYCFVGIWKSAEAIACLLYTSPSPRDEKVSRMPSSA